MRMSAFILLTVVGAVVIAQPLQQFNATKQNVEGQALTAGDCRPGFNFNGGYCVYINLTRVEYQGAVDNCAAIGAFAPSVHSQADINFWVNLANTFPDGNTHFWLDAYCPISGQPYVWRDGTPTDYYGPNAELKQCSTINGYHMEGIQVNGLYLEPYVGSDAPSVCVQSAGGTNPPTTTTTRTSPSTTRTSTITTPRPSTTEPVADLTAGYCSCSPPTIYLDIVFVIDTSDDMTTFVGDASATIQSTLYGLTFGTSMFQSNVAVIAFAESVKVVKAFGDFKTSKDISSLNLPYLGGNADKMEDAIKQASSMVYSNGRDFTRGVIVLLSNSFDQRHGSVIDDAAKAFRDDDNVFITIDYSIGTGIKGLEDITSPGYYINDTSLNPDLDADVLYALCDANCFCKEGLTPYDVDNDQGREVPKGCYHVSGFSAVYDAAQDNCEDLKGFVSTVHDDAKNFFLISLFPPKSRFWLGYQRNGANFEWADGSNDRTAYWAPGNPVAGLDCVYGQQQSGFASSWFSAPCTDPLKNSMPYACQLRPCGSDYDCWA